MLKNVWFTKTVTQRCSVKKVFFKISQIHRKTPVPESPKKRLWHRCFSVNFAKFKRTPFFKEHLQWVFLTLQSPVNRIN